MLTAPATAKLAFPQTPILLVRSPTGQPNRSSDAFYRVSVLQFAALGTNDRFGWWAPLADAINSVNLSAGI